MTENVKTKKRFRKSKGAKMIFRGKKEWLSDTQHWSVDDRQSIFISLIGAIKDKKSNPNRIR